MGPGRLRNGYAVLGDTDRATAFDSANDICAKCYAQFNDWWYHYKDRPNSLKEKTNDQ